MDFKRIECFGTEINIDPTFNEGIILEEIEPVKDDCVWVFDVADLNSSCERYCGMWMFPTASEGYNSNQECNKARSEFIDGN